MTEPMTYNDDVQPICTRHSDSVFTRASECYISGWGKMDPNSKCQFLVVDELLPLCRSD